MSDENYTRAYIRQGILCLVEVYDLNDCREKKEMSRKNKFYTILQKNITNEYKILNICV